MVLRKVVFDDWKILLEWRNDIETRKASHNLDIIKTEDHQKWMKNSLKNPNRQICIVIDNNTPIGSVRADNDGGIYLLSWTVAPNKRGLGYGKKMMKMFVESLSYPLRAEVKKENISSIKIAKHIGLNFVKEENGIMHFCNY